MADVDYQIQQLEERLEATKGSILFPAPAREAVEEALVVMRAMNEHLEQLEHEISMIRAEVSSV